MTLGKILVTGGCGFIGSNFIRLMSGPDGAEIINLDKLTYAGNPRNLSDVSSTATYRFVHGSIEDADVVLNLLQKHNVSAVVNFAAESHVDRSIRSPEPFFETNVTGTLRLLEACRTHWEQLTGAPKLNFRFLHISTDEVYGTLETDAPAFTEQAPYQPNSPYAASKAASDHIVRAYHETYGFPVVTVNCSNNYGPFQFPEKLIPLMIHNALAGKNLPIYGDGQQIRDWLYVTDHCEAIRLVLQSGRVGQSYNVGGRNEVANIDVVHTICDMLEERRPRPQGGYKSLISFVADRPGHDRRYAINCDRISAELGWAPRESFATGLAKTVDWYLDNSTWVEDVVSGDYQNWVREHYGA
jgi:dTDP-glucose 4,6-dehydratase